MHSPDEIQLLCPGQSLWSLISEHASESELLKVYEALDHHLVDMYTVLHTEAETLHRMWQEMQWSGNYSSRAETPFSCPQGFPLADPPAVKELVRAEVKMLLENFKEKACKGAGDDEELLLQYKPEAVLYALDHQETRYSSFEMTDLVRRPSSSCSVQSSADDEIEAISDKLNITEIHKVVTQLRSVFRSECDALTTMIKHFKGIIKQKYYCEPNRSEPSLTELRELRAALQMDLKLLPSSPEASHPSPVKGLKNSFRLPPRQSSAPHVLISTPALRPALPSLCNLKPKPPSPHPLTKPSLSRTHNQKRFASASNILNKPPTCSRMDTSECASTLFTNDPKINQSKNLCSKLKAQNGQQKSNSGGNSEAAAVQMDTSEKSLVISQTPAQHGRKQYKSGLDEDKTSHLRVDTNKQQCPNSHSLTDNSSHPSESSEAERRNTYPQPPSVEMIGKYVILPEKTQRNQKDETQFQFPNAFYQSVQSARIQTSGH